MLKAWLIAWCILVASIVIISWMGQLHIESLENNAIAPIIASQLVAMLAMIVFIFSLAAVFAIPLATWECWREEKQKKESEKDQCNKT